MIESAVAFLQSLPPEGILAFCFAITFVENIFPPSPSDMLLVFCGTFVGIGTVGFLPLLLSATAGSTAGFLVMYFVGYQFGERVIEKGKLPFIPLDSMHKVEHWFQKYGFWLIIANRFLSGTRAIISFFAGMTEIAIGKTTILCTISAAIWNFLLIFGGMELGDHWQKLESVMEDYGKGIAAVTALVALFFILRWWKNKRSAKSPKA